MTREEGIEQTAYRYAVKRQEDPNYPVYNWETEISDAFIAGAEWADKYPQNPQLSAADRGIIDEIIFALNSLGEEKMISYHKEIEFLNKIRKL